MRTRANPSGPKSVQPRSRKKQLPQLKTRKPFPVRAASASPQRKPTAPAAKQPHGNPKMDIDRIPEGSYAISCSIANCTKCHCFTAATISRLQRCSLETIRFSREGSQYVDLQWDAVPASFRTISAFVKMKAHNREHFGNDVSKYPPLYSTPTLEQQEKQRERERKRRNRNNSSAIDLPDESEHPRTLW